MCNFRLGGSTQKCMDDDDDDLHLEENILNSFKSVLYSAGGNIHHPCEHGFACMYKDLLFIAYFDGSSLRLKYDDSVVHCQYSILYDDWMKLENIASGISTISMFKHKVESTKQKVSMGYLSQKFIMFA